MNKYVSVDKLYSEISEILQPLFAGVAYPWLVLPKIKDFILNLCSSGLVGYEVKGAGILVGENVKIHPSAVIEGPAIIGRNTVVRPGAFIRENVIIGDGCVIGNSCELKNCVLMDNVQVPHYNYVGDSVLGKGAHLGAGAICSNLKSDGKNVVIHADVDIDTGLRKVGAFLGDYADVSAGCVINPGTVIGKNTRVYPLVALRGTYPDNSIVKHTYDVVEKSDL